MTVRKLVSHIIAITARHVIKETHVIVLRMTVVMISLFSAKQLICHLLKTEPTQRMTIGEFVSHPWINVRRRICLSTCSFSETFA